MKWMWILSTTIIKYVTLNLRSVFINEIYCFFLQNIWAGQQIIIIKIIEIHLSILIRQETVYCYESTEPTMFSVLYWNFHQQNF